jgi:hypothetical protein
VPREDAETKGKRLLLEARLTIERVDEDGCVIEASCRGTGTVYALGHDEDGWFCNCPARGRCSHLAALQRVVVRPARMAEAAT